MVDCHFAMSRCEVPSGPPKICLYLWLSKRNAETQKPWVLEFLKTHICPIQPSLSPKGIPLLPLHFPYFCPLYLILFASLVLGLFTTMQEAMLLSLFAHLVLSCGSFWSFISLHFYPENIFYILEDHKYSYRSQRGAIYLKLGKCLRILLSWWIKNKLFSLHTIDVSSIFLQCKN